MIVLLFPIIYGLYKSNNFASFSFDNFCRFNYCLYFLVKRNLQTHSFKMLILLIILITGVYLINSDYKYVSTELLFESTLHQGFYENPGTYQNYQVIEKKMYERDLKTILLDEKTTLKLQIVISFL